MPRWLLGARGNTLHRGITGLSTGLSTDLRTDLGTNLGAYLGANLGSFDCWKPFDVGTAIE